MEVVIGGPSLVPPHWVGFCYEVAGSVLMPAPPADLIPAQMAVIGACLVFGCDPVLVHGFPRLRDKGPNFGRLYGHAWIEVGDLCWDPSTGSFITKRLWYEVGKVDPGLCLYVPGREVLATLIDRECWGPWADIPDGALFAENLPDDDPSHPERHRARTS